MPLYEFYSPDTNKLYTFLARSLAYRSVTPVCPDGSVHRMERRVSAFSITGKHKGDSSGEDDPLSHLDEAQVESIMGEMERDMEGISDSNPDPRQLGRLMRKLSDLMGNKTPEALREMVAKLEAGEDPEKLEEQFGGDMPDDPEGGPPEPSATDGLWDTVKKKFASLRGPRRDPRLYELTEWLPK